MFFYELEEKYEGDFLNGYRTGTGSYVYNDGDKYTGEWKRNKRHGKGKLFNYEEKILYGIYEGEWQDDVQNGYGCYQFKYPKEVENDIYSGQWVNNMM